MVITGEASYRLELFFPITFLDANGEAHEIPAILDTGFTAMLTVPQELVDALRLEEQDSVTIVLGDGTERLVPSYLVRLLWEGKQREVGAILADGLPLIGVRLLKGMVAVLHISDGGSAMLFRP